MADIITVFSINTIKYFKYQRLSTINYESDEAKYHIVAGYLHKNYQNQQLFLCENKFYSNCLYTYCKFPKKT